MAKKAKKRVAARKKTSKRGKASAKPARKKAAKRATPKKPKATVRHVGMSATKPAAKKKRRPNTAARKAARKAPRQVAELPVETTIIDVIEEPVPGVVIVTEYQSVRTVTPISPGGGPERGKRTGPGTEEQ